LHDAITGDLIRQIPEDGLNERTAFDVFTFSPDNQWIAAGGEDNIVRVWDVSSGKLKYEFQHESDVSGVSFSPDSRVLASSDKDSAVRFWDVKSGESLYVLRGSVDQRIQNAVYIEGGKKLLVNYYDGKFKQYSLDERHIPVAPLDVVIQTEEQFWEQLGGYRPELVVRFSPDGRTMALIANRKDNPDSAGIQSRNSLDGIQSRWRHTGDGRSQRSSLGSIFKKVNCHA
jgi:WD40 repeat protein